MAIDGESQALLFVFIFYLKGLINKLLQISIGCILAEPKIYQKRHSAQKIAYACFRSNGYYAYSQTLFYWHRTLCQSTVYY